jgi:predicted NACHT family NTPase
MVAEAIHKWEKEHGYISAGTLVAFDVDAYYTALRKRYQVLALEGLTPPQKEEYLQIQLRQVFVEQNVRENPPPVELPKEVWEKLQRDKEIHPEDLPSGITLDDVRKAREAYYEKPSRPVLDVLTDAPYQHTIILGDPGSGKSTLARYILLALIDPAGDEKPHHAFEGYLPLLIELRTYTGACAEGSCGTFLEFLEYLGKTEGWHLTQVALDHHLKNDGRAVVIFDGLDEIFDPEKREQITRQIVGFCNDYPKARVIVTSRVIGYRRKILTDAGFTHFTLQDLDEKQVETFVNCWYDLAMSDRPDEAKERRERILRSFKESASIRQLAGNPMLLTIMAIIGKHQELPRERWKLYDHAASVLIQHWDVNKHLKDAHIDADFIGEDDKKELLRRLAFRMQSGEGGLAGNYIHRDQLQAEFESYLRERYAQTPDRAKVIAEAMIRQFRERNFILSLYGANLYGFVHRAFLEYFCASAFVYKFEKTKELTVEQLKSDVYCKHWENQSWHEVLRLICGMIDEKWSGEIIDHLIKKVYRH